MPMGFAVQGGVPTYGGEVQGLGVQGGGPGTPVRAQAGNNQVGQNPVGQQGGQPQQGGQGQQAPGWGTWLLQIGGSMVGVIGGMMLVGYMFGPRKVNVQHVDKQGRPVDPRTGRPL